MAVGLALILGLLLVTLTVLFHYEVLQFAAGFPAGSRSQRDQEC